MSTALKVLLVLIVVVPLLGTALMLGFAALLMGTMTQDHSYVLPSVLIALVCGAAGIGIIVLLVRGGRAQRVRYTQVGGPVLSWQAAEQMAANHMRAYGFSDARTTRGGSDGGLDVVSRWGVAQVKYFSKPVGRPEVQKLRGAAHGRDRVLFYALTGFNTNAVQFANECGIALFQFDQRGMVWPVNALAKAYKKPEPTTA